MFDENFFSSASSPPPTPPQIQGQPLPKYKNTIARPPTPPAKVVAFKSHSTVTGARGYFLYLNIGWG